MPCCAVQKAKVLELRCDETTKNIEWLWPIVFVSRDIFLKLPYLLHFSPFMGGFKRRFYPSKVGTFQTHFPVLVAATSSSAPTRRSLLLLLAMLHNIDKGFCAGLAIISIKTFVQGRVILLKMSEDSDFSKDSDVMDDEFPDEDDENVAAETTKKSDGFADMMSKILNQKVGDKVRS